MTSREIAVSGDRTSGLIWGFEKTSSKSMCVEVEVFNIALPVQKRPFLDAL
jgi:hypothetical protein